MKKWGMINMFKLIKRTIKLISQVQPGYLPILVLANISSQLTPFINVYMAAEIVNEIAGNRNLHILISQIIFTILSNLIIGLVQSILKHFLSNQATAFRIKEPALFNDKFMALKYADLENPDILQIRRKIQSSSAINKFGIYNFLDTFDSLTIQIVNIILSILLSYELFLTVFSDATHPIMIILLIILILLIIISIYINYKNSNKLGKKSNELTESMLMINRINNETNAYNKGKDIRLYKLDIPIMQEEQYRLQLNQSIYKSFSYFEFLFGLPNKIIPHIINGLIYTIVCVNFLWGLFGIGSVIKYVTVFNRMINALQYTFDVIAKIKINKSFLEDYFNFFDLPEAENRESTYIPDNKRYYFEFVNVTFKYPNAGTYALENINIKFSYNKKMVFVGRNGSGKTTFVKLLTRMYTPTSGKILLNGRDIQTYDYKEYLKIFAVVFQDFSLFPFTLGQNIAANINYDDPKVREQLEKVDFGKRLSKMSNQLNTYLYKDFDEKGIEISGGEAQKIALARAFYKDAPLLILDEPTAALDPMAEFKILSFINNVTENKAVIFITHRLSICPIADEIIVFQDGKIAQRGTHKELLKDIPNKYFQMWKAQSKYYV